MKNGTSENTEAATERCEKAKKLYRYVTDVARRVDEATASSHNAADLFTVKIEVLRQKLRDNCEKLMFLDPLNYGKKALELLWRKVYYETISAFKKHRESNNEDDNLLSIHIVCGIGHFHNIITKVESQTKILLYNIDYTSQYKDEESEDVEVSTSEELQQVGKSILYSCMVYLGDLSRYQVELFPAFYDPSIAARYYLQAAHIDLSSGMPYNQLGNLYLDKNHNIDSVCYYIQCLSCTETFEGALGNLTKLFEKNAQYSNILEDSETLTQTEHIQGTLAKFLSLIELWYMGNNDTDVPERCNLIAHQLKASMDFNRLSLPDINMSYDEYQQAVEEENINPSYMNSSLIHKIVLICLFTCAKLEETDEKKAFACKAFTLALLSQLLQKLFQQLAELGLKNPADKYRKPSLTQESDPEVKEIIEEVIVPNIVENGDNSEEVKEEIQKDGASQSEEEISEVLNGEAQSGKKTANKRRRRRRAGSDSSEDSDTDSDSEVDDDESMSPDDNLTDSSFESEDDKSDISDNEEKIDTKSTVTTNGAVTETKVDEVDKSKILTNGISKGVLTKQKSVTDEETKASLIQHFLAGDNILPSIKLLLDWALNEKDLIMSCGESGESLFQCVVDLLNTLTFNFKPTKKHSTETCEILDYAKKLAKNLELEYKSIPLPEDVNLRGTNICKFDKDAAEWQILGRYQPSVYEENVIRILNFIDFGNQIAKLVPRIRLNRSMQILYLKKTTATKVSAKLGHKKTREWHNSKKPPAETSETGLLRRLGRLWLTARVRELERSGRAAPQPTLLALDAAALNKHLKKVKSLLKARTFVLLIPAIVLQELDALKREESSARDAIRWLESQLQGGSRFVRAQRPGQARPLPLLKYPRKAPPHVHNYIQVLEYCHHFVADEKPQGGNGDPDSAVHAKSAPLLVLLTGSEPGAPDDYKEFSVRGAAQAAGVAVQYIGSFHATWRQAAHKSGKKR